MGTELKDTFVQAYNDTYDYINRFLTSKLPTRDLIEDALQSVYLDFYRSLIRSYRFLLEASTQSQTASSSSKEAVPAKNRCNTFLSIRYISTSRKQPPKILSEYFHLPLFSGC